MKRAALATGLAAAVLLAAATAASAHPLGNFTINHLAEVTISSDRVGVHYVLDQAEIPTFQERDLPPAEVLSRKRGVAVRGLHLMLNGHAVPLTLAPGGTISFPPGQGGLKLTRVELDLSARVHDQRAVQFRDDTFTGRLGWREIVVRRGRGTDVRSTAPSNDPTGALRHYPQDLLSSPFDQRMASFTVRPGNGALVAPRSPGGRLVHEGHPAGDGFASVFAKAASGKQVLVLLLLAAFGWGALHALSPGHGKAMVAAYLAGTRGEPRHAVALGATVTISHTAGVFALGFVTLALSQYVLPEQLYPWLTLTSGALVVIIGLTVLRSRVRWARSRGAHTHAGGDAHGHDHGHSHDHAPPGDLTTRGLIALGASAGLIPCPSALVVLLAAVSQHQVALGLLLITVFSLGLAATITGLGLAVVYARRFTTRLSFSGRIAAILPAASALAIVGVGCVLTAKAVAGVA